MKDVGRDGGTGAAGVGDAGASLPDAKGDLVGAADAHDVHIGPVVEVGFDRGSGEGQIDLVRVVDLADDMRIADVARFPALHRRNRSTDDFHEFGDVRSRPRAHHAHVDRSGHDMGLIGVVHRALAYPGWGGHLEVEIGHTLRPSDRLGEAAQAVAAESSGAAITVEQPHDDVALIVMVGSGRQTEDQAIGTDAGAAIAPGAGARDGVEWKVFGEADEKVVAKTVEFGETDRRRRGGHGPIIAGNGRTSTGCSAECDQRPAAADQCSMTASTSGGASTQRMRGSRRNQRSCRRAN